MGKYNFDLELVHQNSLLLILEQIKSNTVVLEFGPANGRLTRYLKEQLGCQVYLVELDGEAGKEALRYGVDLVIGDIEAYEWFEQFGNIRFDYIIFADVLEHLHCPLEVIKKSKLLLKETGSILLSVPNFAHNAVLINLLNHNFQYNSIGLLDNTHIHMFTKNSLEDMLREADLYPSRKMATYADTEGIEIPASLQQVPGIDAEYWKNRPFGEVYQFIYEVKKNAAFCNEIENVLVKAKSGSYAQIFWSCGEVFSEECSKRVRIAQASGIQEFSLNCHEPCLQIRVDPMDAGGLVRLVDFSAEDAQGNVFVELREHNAAHNWKNLYFFSTSDPQWVFSLTKPAEKFKISIEYLSIGYVSLFSSALDEIDLYLKSIQSKADSLLLEKKEVLESLNTEREACQQELSKLNMQIESLKSEYAKKDTLLTELSEQNNNYQEKISEQLLMQQRLRNANEELEKSNLQLAAQLQVLESQIQKSRQEAENKE